MFSSINGDAVIVWEVEGDTIWLLVVINIVVDMHGGTIGVGVGGIDDAIFASVVFIVSSVIPSSLKILNHVSWSFDTAISIFVEWSNSFVDKRDVLISIDFVPNISGSVSNV